MLRGRGSGGDDSGDDSGDAIGTAEIIVSEGGGQYNFKLFKCLGVWGRPRARTI